MSTAAPEATGLPVEGPGGGAERDRPPVRVVDLPSSRVHLPADLVGVVLAVLGIGVVLVLAVYAQGTTTGVAADVQGFASIVKRILVLPVTLLETIITFAVPVAVLTELVLRRLVRHTLEAVGAAVLAIAFALATSVLISTYGTEVLQASFSVRRAGELIVTIPALLTGTAALITVAGTRARRRTVGPSWNLLWLGLGVALATALITLPGALMTVLLGRAVGLGVRYLSGVQSERAYGDALVDGVRRAGFDPVELVRVWDVTLPELPGEPDQAGEPGDDEAAAVLRQLSTEPASVALARQGDHRVYAMTTAAGERLDVVVLDGDRQVVSLLLRSWRSLRLRGIDGRGVVSLRQVAERAALLSYAASAAGVGTPRLLALSEAEDSMILVHEHLPQAVPLGDLPDEALTDEVLDAVWAQLRRAHRAGLAHRALTSDAVLVDLRPDGPPSAVLSGWESGDVASSHLARRVDVSQLLALLALRVGAARAVASASRVLPDADLAATGPFLQSIALPRRTREEAKQHKGVFAEVREALLALLPEVDVEPENLVRFGLRTVLTLGLTVTAFGIVVTQVNFEQISAAFLAAEPWWVAVAFLLGMVTFVGAALSLVAFAPVKLPLWRTTLVQCAGAFVALVAPAGIGPAALNLRMLTKRGVGNALAVASVGLVQVSHFVTTMALLLIISLFSGASAPLQAPSRTTTVAIAVVVLAVAAAMLVPRVRAWVMARLVPLWRQTWPRFIQLLTQPVRFAIASGGNLIMTLGYVGAFGASLLAFGQELNLLDLALIYLVGNATGALVPTPGGLGVVEAALIAGLIGAGGVDPGIAASAVFLFRGLTFWARVPFGWLSMRVLQRSGEL